MLEAKYQAWFDGEMISDWYPRTQFRICTGWDNKIGLETFSTMEEGIFNGEPVTLPVWKSANGAKLRQYTGLKDRNGKEIYEGDIFQAGSYPLTKEDDYVGVVEYDHDRFWGVRRVKAGSDVRGISGGMADGLWEFIDESTEVIGNIYEHPHLLNQE
ncbi:YopX family protein [Brevibacillus laterosporus]|uniref:YopX family protein n=1 Tax=Brevibacillus laterosporus TaxID=1465 RepID=UPI00215C59E8|nr:YopX family protein [Brevibacillus laterosporus]MCR8994506.1 YopX family protein [Brevibacillus laterosporus]